MPNPTPIYVVEYGGLQLPGYVQSIDRPTTLVSNVNTYFGRDGASLYVPSAEPKKLTIDFLIMTRLGTNSSGLLHLDDIMDQYREALAILTRSYGQNTLRIQDSDRYYLAIVDNVGMPVTAQSSTRGVYTVSFTAQPWAYGSTDQSSSFTGNGTVTVTGLEDSRRTYPILSVPNGVTAFTATSDAGQVIDFVRGSFTGVITVNCANLTAVTAAGVNAINTMDNLNFGIYYAPNIDGELEFVVTGFAGSGTVDVDVTPRYEL